MNTPDKTTQTTIFKFAFILTVCGILLAGWTIVSPISGPGIFQSAGAQDSNPRRPREGMFDGPRGGFGRRLNDDDAKHQMSELDALQFKRAKLLSKVKSDDPMILETDMKIRLLQEQIANRTKLEQGRIKLEKQIAELEVYKAKRLEKFHVDHQEIDEIETQIARVKEELDGKRESPSSGLSVKFHSRDPMDIVSEVLRHYGPNVSFEIDYQARFIRIRVVGAQSVDEANHLLSEISATIKKWDVNSEVEFPVKVGRFPIDQVDQNLDRHAKQLAAKSRDAGPEEKAQLKKELEAITEKQFDHRQQRRAQEFALLSERVERLKATHARRQASRSNLIRRRVDDLLDPNADLSWDDPDVAATELPTNIDTPNERSASKNDTPTEVPASRVPESTKEIEVARDSKRSEFVVPSDRVPKTYDGMSYDEAMRLIVNDRKTDKVTQAILAVNHLLDEGEPREIARVTFYMMRFQNLDPINGTTSILMDSSVVLLRRLPSPIVVEALIDEILSSGNRKSTRSFVIYFLQRYSWVGNIYSTGPNNTAPLLLAVDNESLQEESQRLSQEIRRESRKLAHAVTDIAKQNDALGDWAMSCALQITRISKQPIKSYPELVSLAQQVFDTPAIENPPAGSNRKNGRVIAARLLGASGIREADVLAFADQKFERADLVNKTQPEIDGHEFAEGIDCLVALAPHSPKAVDRLSKLLHTKWDDLVTRSAEARSTSEEVLTEAQVEEQNQIQKRISRSNHQLAQLINALVLIGQPAKVSIPMLQEIANSPKANNFQLINISGGFGAPGTLFFGGGGGGGGGGFMGGSGTVPLREQLLLAIQRIEAAKPRPEPELLMDDESRSTS